MAYFMIKRTKWPIFYPKLKKCYMNFGEIDKKFVILNPSKEKLLH